MSDLLADLLERADFPIEVSRSLQGARALVTPSEMSAAIDRMAVGLTAELQEQSPLLLGVLPGGSYLLGTLMQRMVFPLQIAHCGFQGDEPTLSADGSSLAERLIVVIDDGHMSARQEEALLGRLSTERVGSVWRCSLIRSADAGAAFDRQLTVVISDPAGVFGCGLDVAGYCRNLPGLYRTA